MLNLSPRALIPLWCLLVVSARASAQTNGQAVALPEVVVTATRGERPPWQTPSSLDLLGEEELRIRRPARTVPESLKLQAGTMVQKTGHGQGSPYVRGFTGFRNLFLIDGVRLNNSVFRDGPNQYWNTVDSLGISRMEFVRGPFSVLYGSDAIGGTVNALTRGAGDLAPGSDWERRVYYRYGSAENSHIARTESIGQFGNGLAGTFGFSYKDFGDLEGGKNVGTQEMTGYDEVDWDARLEYFPAENTTLVLAHQGVSIDDAWRTHKTIYGIDWEGLTVGNELRRVLDQDRRLTYLQLHRENLGGFVDELHAGVSHHLQKEERDRLRTRDRHDAQGFDVNALGAFLSLESPTDFGYLVYGAEYYRDTVDSFRHTLDGSGTVKRSAIQGPVGDDATYDTLGAYLQDEISDGKRLSLILGGRYEYARARADAVEDPATGESVSVSDDFRALVGSARALCALNEARSCNLFAGVSQGFRAPNLSDLTRLDSARTDEIETPSPDLDPEQFLSYEVGFKAQSDTFSAQLAYFFTHIRDLIVRAPTGRLVDGDNEVTKRNAGDGYLHGIELQADWRVAEEWSVFGAFTWMDGEVETYPTSDPVAAKEPIDRLMPPTGHIGLRWDNGRYWAEVSCVAASDADKLSTRDRADTSRIPPGGTPGYAVCDVRGGCRIHESLSLSLAVENLSDEDYRIHGSGINESGRNVVVAGEWTF